MLKVQEIRELIKLIDDSSIDEFTYESNGTTISMKKQKEQVVERIQTQTKEEVQAKPPQQVAPAPAETVEVSNSVQDEVNAKADVDYDFEIVSPMVGTFYEASSPEEDPFVKVGDAVQADTVVCIVEAMKLFNEIEAEQSGEIVEVLVENGQLVEYGQPLFLVKAK
ncbi:acetyl-CoA carboxylase biotin carboxyl carrier protein [Pontibacillus litoralis]|uniref:Biotin carboxyl carrier protein of acetyl-CoA carboxylase n=1 Tax=Pontibacillus litoralis JSM 072002 TaxID=1385512 RepID=A0A0A5G6T2_9BACI|nr:acetyl-CoA carboxylase biotin carboxyl carrier protein [Pontibacillus litoralis]KGX88841.1 acetyl-CoA carboxylase [Pontibacillus litoralis JSM 072002]